MDGDSLHSDGNLDSETEEAAMFCNENNGECNEDFGEDGRWNDTEVEEGFDLEERSCESNTGDSDEDEICVDGMEDIVKLDLRNLMPNEIARCSFVDVDVAFLFYNWLGRMRGFFARRDKVLRNKKGEVVQQTFVCYRQGKRICKKDDEDENGDKADGSRREPKRSTRCGCEAKFRVHVDIFTGRWYVTYYVDMHNHELLDPKSSFLLAGHKNMTETDVIQMNNYMKVGISTPQMFGAFANQSGDFRNVGFIMKGIQNQIARQRKKQQNDAKGAIAYLKELPKKDPLLFYKHTVDEEGRLQHLFWCDGNSRLNYGIFGDVIAFDATYCKNKYMCPIVFFSGVNHHNKTTIFATAFIANETEETYVWLLEKLLEAMDGKAPVSVITDGDLAMRNAISRIFPNAWHRLCAWHLLRNATSNVSIPDFTSDLKVCMLYDLEVSKFNKLWQKMILEYGLGDNTWVKDLYDKKHMWATAYLRGNFFAGYRTTSRCESFHALIGRYVHKKTTLIEFMQCFHRCLDRMHFNEEEDDFKSLHGDAVMRTHYVCLERYGSRIFTKEMFKTFRNKLEKSCRIRVVSSRQTTSSCIFTLGKYRSESTLWPVSVNEDTQEFKCSCMRMESFGLPCEHILRVLVELDFGELPNCLVLHRWTKNARQSIEGRICNGNGFWDSTLTARFVALNERSREMNEVGCRTLDRFYSTLDVITEHTNAMKLEDEEDANVNLTSMHDVEDEVLLNPARVRSKGCPASSSRHSVKGKRKMTCRICKGVGHNRKGCPTQKGGAVVQENVE